MDIKFQPHRILVTHHQDLSVQFFDLSAQLLIPPPSAPIENDFPKIIPSLTLHLKPILMEIATSKKLPHFSDATTIQSVHFATEALECAIVLDTGEVIVCRSPTVGIMQGGMQRDSEIIELQHTRSLPGCKLVPSFLLATGRGNATTCAISDSGELLNIESPVCLIDDVQVSWLLHIRMVLYLPLICGGQI